MHCTRLAANAGCKKSSKKSPSGHHRTILSGYVFSTKAYRQSKKPLLSSNISCTCRQNMVNFALHYCSDVAQRKPTKLCTMFGPLLVDYIYIFGGCCSITKFRQVQNSLCVLQVLRCPIGSVTARQSSSGRDQTLRR